MRDLSSAKISPVILGWRTQGSGLFSLHLSKRQWFPEFRDSCCSMCSSRTQQHSRERDYFLKPKKIYTLTTQVRQCLSGHSAAAGERQLARADCAGKLHSPFHDCRLGSWSVISRLWGFLCSLSQKATGTVIRPILQKPSCVLRSQLSRKEPEEPGQLDFVSYQPPFRYFLPAT